MLGQRRPFFRLPLCLLLVCGCSDQVTVGNASPQGSVGGLIVNAATHEPLAGAEVTALAGGHALPTFLTGDDGTFTFDEVPAGSVVVMVSGPAGFWGATLRGDLSGEAGQFPTGNQALTLGPIGLVPAGSSFQFRILDLSATAVPSYDITAQTVVEWVDLSSGAPSSVGERVLAAQSDSSGVVMLTGLPNFATLGPTISSSVVITLPPYDADGDGSFEYGGGSRVFDLRLLDNPSPSVVLDSAYDAQLSVEASTIPALVTGATHSNLPAVVDANAPLFVKFSLPLRKDVVAELVDELGGAVSPAPITTLSRDLLTINASGLAMGVELNLHVRAVADVAGPIIQGDFYAPFFTKNPLPQVTAEISVWPVGGNMHLLFSEPVGTGDPATNRLDGENCVLFFDAQLGGTADHDFPGEYGYEKCNGAHALLAAEPDPPGPAGKTGYTTLWEIVPPSVAPEVLTLRPLHIILSRVTDPTRVLRRADGRVVGDFTKSGAILIKAPTTP